MPYEQRLRVPLTDDFSVNVQININPCNSAYTADITAEGNWWSFPINVTPRDVEAINSELQQAIEEVSTCFNESDGTIDDTFDDTLAELARKGKWAFNEIFQQGKPREIISNALKVGKTIQFTSQNFFLPWELLYDGRLNVETDVTCFWGMRHIVTRQLKIENPHLGQIDFPEIASSPHVGLIADTDLEYIKKEEYPTLKEFHRNNQIDLSHLGSMNSRDRDQHDKELKKLHRFFHKNMQITHLACHAEVNKKNISESFLRVSNNFEISISDFVVGEFDIKHRPLIILNACLTGIINPLHSCNWVIEFIKHGARGVLATEFHVPDWFAAVFIKELYNSFLSGVPIGEALTTTRRLIWNDKHNPLGLAYALYSSPSIRIRT